MVSAWGLLVNIYQPEYIDFLLGPISLGLVLVNSQKLPQVLTFSLWDPRKHYLCWLENISWCLVSQEMETLKSNLNLNPFCDYNFICI